MDRRAFIRSCGYACAGGIGLAAALQSCTTTRMIPGTISGEYLVVDLEAFETQEANTFRKYVIVQNDALKFPICVYRFSATDFTAIYLQCTHQGAELQVFGDKLQCPAHGSEFSSRGSVENGPATTSLRTFQTTLSANQLNISLK